VQDGKRNTHHSASLLGETDAGDGHPSEQVQLAALASVLLVLGLEDLG